MKKKICLGLIITTLTTASVYAREEFYMELDGGYDKSLTKGPSDYPTMRIGAGTHLFKSEKSKNYYGIEGHLGTNLLGSSWENHSVHYSVDSMSYYSADISGLIGYETNNHTDIALKLGIRGAVYDNSDRNKEKILTNSVIVPQIGLGLGIPLHDQLKLTTEVNYRFVGASANVGLRYTF